MKIKKVYENKVINDTYYQVRQYTDIDEYLIIPPEENNYTFNYDAYNLEEVIEFYFETIKEENGDFKVVKITEEEIEDDKMRMMKDAKKYNL